MRPGGIGSNRETPVWVTAQGLAAAFSSEFPLKPVARAPKPPKDDTTNGSGTYNGTGGTYDGSYDYGSSGTDLGDLYAAGGSSGSSDGGIGRGAGGKESEADTGGAGDPLAASGEGRERIAANAADADAAASDDGADDKFEAPATPVLLGGLGGLTALLGAGFIWFTRRLP